MKFRNVAKRYGGYVVAGVVALPGLALAQSTGSYIPSSASGMFTQMQSDFTTLFGLGFGVLVLVTGSFMAWRYTRKLGTKV